MIKLDWRKFEIINEKYTDAFQTLCLHLFSRFVHKDNIHADFNQKGIETEPVEYKGKFYGFQSKYFENGMDYKQIDKSVRDAIDSYQKIDVIKIYYNCNAVLSRSKIKHDLEKYAKEHEVKLEWIGRESFETTLNNKKNLDLCQLFFGAGRELEYFSDTISKEKRELFKSKEYLELETKCSGHIFRTSQDLVKNLMESKGISVIKGSPGTGKSVLQEKIFTILSGVDCEFYEQIKTVSLNKCIPMLIKLKYCATTSLEQLINEKKTEYKISFEHYKIVYLLDGLDEVSSEKAERIVSYIQDLKEHKSTKKIIITIRKASPNNVFLRKTVNPNNICEISNLDRDKIFKYFQDRSDKKKCEMLSELKKSKSNLLDEIEDILLVKLLYDTIERVCDATDIYDLFLLKEKYWVDFGQNKIAKLDLPEPKADSILAINEKIAYTMHCNQAVIISKEDFYEIIYSKFPRISYTCANEVSHYLLDSYFENSIEDEYYSYQHRRYQEYFYILYLYKLYGENVRNLRKEEIFTNSEFFEGFFLPFIEKKSDEEKNLPYSLEVKLINTYMGKNPMWGADKPWYQYSDDFCYAVASQSDKIFHQIIEDANLPIKGNAFIDLEYIEKVAKWVLTLRYGIAPDPVEEMFRFALRSIVIYWKCEKKEFAQILLEELKNGIQLIKDKYSKLEKHIWNAFFEEKYSQYFIRLILLENPLLDVLSYINEHEVRERIVSRKTKYVESLEAFFEISMHYRFEEFTRILNTFTPENLEYFCCSLMYAENIKFLKQDAIANKLRILIRESNEDTIGISMMKVYFKVNVTPEGQNKIDEEFKRLSEERWIDLYGFNKEHDRAAFLTLIKNENCVADRYRHDSRVMYQNLYCNYCKVLDGEMTYSKMISTFLLDKNNAVIEKYNNITYYVTKFCAEVFNDSKLTYAEKQNIIQKISEESNKTIHMGLLFKLLKRKNWKSNDKLLRRFSTVIREEYKKDESIDISENISKYFNVSYLYSALNSEISLAFMYKGLNYGVLRHGWRKDGIVDTYLLDALEIIWEKNYFEWDELKKYSLDFFKMILVINKITDENYRCGSLEKLMRVLLNNDFVLAQQVMKSIIENRLQTNQMIFEFLEQMVNIGMEINEIRSWFEYFDFANYNEESVTMELQLLLGIYYSDWYDKKKRDGIKENIIRYMEFGWGISNTQWSDRYYGYYKEFCKSENIDEVQIQKYSRIEENASSNEICYFEKIQKCKSKTVLKKLYSELADYNKHIVIKSGKTWNLLVEKTFKIDGNFDELLEYMEQCKFPHETFYSANSPYFYMPLGYILQNYGMSEPIWCFLKNNGGYADFINLIKAYDYIDEREECRKLFKRFFQFCELLVFDDPFITEST